MSSAELARLYDDHAPALFGFVLNLLRHEADTRDVLQEVFCKLAAHPDLTEILRDERAWLLRVAHHQALDHLRRRGSQDRLRERYQSSTPDLFAPGAHPDESRFRQALSEAMADLPTDQRAVVHLKLWEGLTFDAIATLLGIPPNTAASRYRYGLDKLQTQLRPLYEEVR